MFCHIWHIFLTFYLTFYLAFYLPILSGISFCHFFWHSFWHSIWYIFLTYLLAFYLAYLLAFYLVYLLAFYLTYLLAFYPAFYLAYLLAFYLTYLLAFYLAFYLAYLSGISSGISIWHIYLAYRCRKSLEYTHTERNARSPFIVFNLRQLLGHQISNTAERFLKTCTPPWQRSKTIPCSHTAHDLHNLQISYLFQT